jgi:hypothetical protein
LKTSAETEICYFSLVSYSIERSTHVSVRTQLAVFVHGIDMELSITEELAALISMKGITTGEDLYEDKKTLQSLHIQCRSYLG